VNTYNPTTGGVRSIGSDLTHLSVKSQLFIHLT